MCYRKITKFCSTAKKLLNLQRLTPRIMNTSVIVRFVILGLLWLGLVCYIVAHTRMSLYTVFVFFASAIIIFVPMYKKYIRK